MGNTTSSVAEIKKKGDEYNKAVRRERALSGMPGLSQQMSSKRFKKADPFAEQWKVISMLCTFYGQVGLSRVELVVNG